MMVWNNIYSHFDPIAFKISTIAVHWYGLMHVIAFLIALFFAKWIAKKDKYPLLNPILDSYFLWVEVGVVLGARLGYIIFYEPYTSYYFAHPWQIFNPFDIYGEFVGIRGMSYHGAVIGFLIATIIFTRIKKVNFWILADLAGISIPLGYVFGRIGNFLNQELVGRETTSSFGILVDGVLRHPSQLYEAFLEGVVVFILLYFYRKKAHFIGEIGILYGILYSLMRFIAEFFREPDVQLGFIAFDWLTQGQLLSLLTGGFCLILWGYKSSQNKAIKANG